LRLPFTVLLSIAIGNFCLFLLIIRDGKLKNSKLEGNKDEEEEKEEARRRKKDMYDVPAKLWKEIIDIYRSINDRLIGRIIIWNFVNAKKLLILTIII
jgi:hypothetical protein